MYNVNIVQTGSAGNSIVIDDHVMIDCGLPKKSIGKLLETEIDQIFVSHQHGDHVNIALLKAITKTRPNLIRYGLHVNAQTLAKIDKGAPMVADLVDPANIITCDSSITVATRDSEYKIETFELYHDVENQGFVFTKLETGETLLHATDTRSLKSAPNVKYDYLLVEGNWDEQTLQAMLESDDPGEQFRAIRNLRHLSVQAFERFARTHSHENSVLIQLHESYELGSTSRLNGVNVDGSVSVEEKYANS